MRFLTTALLALSAPVALAQQYAGDTISAYLPTMANMEVAFWRINDPSGKNNNLTLINYQSLGTDGGRVVDSNIQRAVIVVHGLLRDPYNYCNDAINALAKVTDPEITRDSVSIVAPYFPNGDDKTYAYPWTTGLKANRGSTTNALVWSGSQWSAGADNQYPYTSTNTSSYYVLDEMIRYYDNQTLFPNMKQIVLVGHSLGGQMLQRYAAVGDQLGTTSPVVLWIGNPDSYAWLNAGRPLTVPNCPDYDDYRDGFTNYTEYPMTYGTSLVAQGTDAILANYQTKQIAYARGLLDFGNQARTCGANTTGVNRNERFFFYIEAFPPTCDDPTGTSCDTVDLIPVSHDNGQMFGSAAGLARIFTDNFYGNHSRAYDFGYPRKQSGDDPFPNPALEGESGVTITGTWSNMTYQGCWTDQYPNTALALDTLLYDNSGNSIEGCTSGCAGAGYGIAGLQDGTKCYCGNTLNTASAVLIVDMSCSTVCPGNTYEICGGTNRISLFSNGYPATS